jgi:hypothetical protein
VTLVDSTPFCQAKFIYTFSAKGSLPVIPISNQG